MNRPEALIHRSTFLLLAAGLLALASGAAAATCDPELELVKLPGSRYTIETSRVRLGDGPTRAVLPVPIELAEGLNAAELEPRVFDVRLGDRRWQELKQAFAVEPRPATGEQAAELAIQVALGPKIGDGTYDLLIDLDHPASGRCQRLALQIVHPAAQIRPPGTLIIDRTVGFLGDPETVPRPLELREISGLSHVEHATLEQVEIAAGGGRVELDAVPRIAAEGSATLEPRLKGDFALDKVAGKLELNAPQLASPLFIDFEVRSRRPASWVAWILITGLVVGYLLRTHLGAKVELEELRMRGWAVHERIRTEKEKHLDEKLRARLDELGEKLEKDLADRRPDFIKKRIEETEQAIADAREDLATRAGEAGQTIAGLETLVATPWSLPAALSRILGTAREAVAEARRQLENGLVEPARTAAGRLAAGLDGDVKAAAVPWQKGELDRHLALDEERSLLLRPLLDALSATRKLARDAAVGVPARSPQAEARTLLVAIDKAQVQLQYLAEALDRRLGALVDAVLAVLDPEGGRDSGPIAELRAAAAELRQEVAASDQPGSALDLILRGQEVLTGKLEAAVLSRVPLGGSPAAVKALLDQGQFRNAAEQAVRPPASRSVDDDLLAADDPDGWGQEAFEITGDGSAPESEAEAEAEAPRLAGTREPAIVRVQRAFDRLWSGGGKITPARTMAALLQAKLLRWLLSGAIILAVGYTVFSDGFVGQWREILTIFFWAFGLDVAVDSVATASGKLGR